MKLLMLQGLPASGKSTFAKAQSAIRVNKDAIREELKASGWTWSRENEKQVLDIRDSRIIEAIKGGKDVISDDTNFGRDHKVKLRGIAESLGATFGVLRFDVPLQECLTRNASRTGSARVPDDVILKMYKTYVEKDPAHFPLSAPPLTVVKAMNLPTNPTAVICDLDGTLALFEGKRSPYNASTCDQDDVNPAVRFVLENVVKKTGTQILFVSGREDVYREPTLKFLGKMRFHQYPLWMRKAGDTRKGVTVKMEIFDKEIRDKYHVLFVLDDRDVVVNMWRQLGLTCFQVAN